MHVHAYHVIPSWTIDGEYIYIYIYLIYTAYVKLYVPLLDTSNSYNPIAVFSITIKWTCTHLWGDVWCYMSWWLSLGSYFVVTITMVTVSYHQIMTKSLQWTSQTFLTNVTNTVLLIFCIKATEHFLDYVATMWHVEIKQEPIQNAVHDSKFADT